MVIVNTRRSSTHNSSANYHSFSAFFSCSFRLLQHLSSAVVVSETQEIVRNSFSRWVFCVLAAAYLFPTSVRGRYYSFPRQRICLSRCAVVRGRRLVIEALREQSGAEQRLSGAGQPASEPVTATCTGHNGKWQAPSPPPRTTPPATRLKPIRYNCLACCAYVHGSPSLKARAYTR